MVVLALNPFFAPVFIAKYFLSEILYTILVVIGFNPFLYTILVVIGFNPFLYTILVVIGLPLEKT
ncbi:MAG TPA: hypothetical protein EYP59_11995 [Thiotrichaceae bacterium]|nr:hypothetical protein [Thiotrichaceae bacterium]